MADCSIELSQISVTYPNGKSALDDVSLTLREGTIYGLIGANGAGKSTLFKSIMGMVKPTAGQVTIAGRSVRDALRQNLVSYVPQTEDVDWNFPVLVEDVVMTGRYGHMGFLRIPNQRDKEVVQEALQRVDMAGFAKRQIGELSGGQKKRVFVARALAQEGQILLLDEPFAGVDIKTEESLAQLLRGLAREGRLILVSTHNLGSVPSFCDEAILIDRSVLAAGPVATTLTQENLLRAFGGMLRDVTLGGQALHQDPDERALTVLTDDERPLVLYGAKGGEKIVTGGRG